MPFERNGFDAIGEKIGYAAGYFLLTTASFFMLAASHKIPDSWTYFHVMGIVLFVTLIGVTLRRMLK